MSMINAKIVVLFMITVISINFNEYKYEIVFYSINVAFFSIVSSSEDMKLYNL